MKKLKTFLKKLWEDESGQGATEYILMLVIVVAIAIIFKDRIQSIISGKVEEVAGEIDGFRTR